MEDEVRDRDDLEEDVEEDEVEEEVEQVEVWLPEMEVPDGRLLVASWWIVKDC